jgi:hypothetical protein
VIDPLRVRVRESSAWKDGETRLMRQQIFVFVFVFVIDSTVIGTGITIDIVVRRRYDTSLPDEEVTQ